MKPTGVPAFELLKDLLISKYDAKLAAGGKEIVKRCHYCGDSRNMSSRHMYIGISKGGSIVYNCFKCGAKGIVDSKFFIDIGEYDDSNTIDSVDGYNKSKQKSISRNYTGIIKSSRMLNPVIRYEDTELNRKKLDYINTRMGMNLTYSDLRGLKIVLDLGLFLKDNYVEGITRSEGIVKSMAFGFIGFLSVDNLYITMRRLVKKESVYKTIQNRYTNYNIYGNNEGDGQYYAIPTTLDLSKHINIHIAEGPFDIVGIWRDHKDISQNSIWVAVCGKSYLNPLTAIICTLGLIDFDIHIYPDNDVSDRQVMKELNPLNFLNCNIYCHRNAMDGEKDFGVSPDKIKEVIMKIK